MRNDFVRGATLTLPINTAMPAKRASVRGWPYPR